MQNTMEGQEALNMLYASGLNEFNNGRRLTEYKEIVFIKIWEKPRSKKFAILADEIHITYGTFKIYAGNIYEIIGQMTGEKVNLSTFKSVVHNFLLKMPNNMTEKITGGLLKQGSIREILKPENLISVQEYAQYKSISQEQAINDLIQKGWESTDD
jgi:hypothetical protein